VAALCFFSTAHAAQSIAITVGVDAIAQFLGFGSNVGGFQGSLTLAQKREITSVVWKDLNLRLCRFYRSHQDWDINTVLDEYGEEAALVREVQPEIKFLYNPTGRVNNDAAAWARSIAGNMKLLHDEGFSCHATGIGNEPSAPFTGPWPDWAACMSASIIPAVIKNLRVELDDRGLDSVKIIACESSNVDDYYWEFAEGMEHDPDALSAIDHFAHHGYNMSMTNEMYEFLKPLGKDGFYQTESCHDGANEGYNDSAVAAETAARFLCDLNFGTIYWLYWFDKGSGLSGVNDTRLVGYDGSTGEYRLPLKYHYIKLLSQTFVPGSALRKSTTDLGDRTGRREDTYMEYTYGRKVPVAAAAAVNPDGKWIIGIANITGLEPRWPETTFYPRDTYSATFEIEELRSAGELRFDAWRCNNGTGSVKAGSTVLMTDGRMSVDVGPCDLVCLVSTTSAANRLNSAHPPRRAVARDIATPELILGGRHGQMSGGHQTFDIRGRAIEPGRTSHCAIRFDRAQGQH